MAMTLKQIRENYPEYEDLSDIELADKIHSKFYPDLPKEDVYSKLEIAKPLELELVKGEEPTERTGILGVVGDIGHELNNALKFALTTPGKLEKMGQYIEANPFSALPHMAGQLAAETADIGKGIINAPYNLNQYLARKHLLPSVLGRLGKFIPHLPEDTGIERALGLEASPEKGDELIRAIPDVATLFTGGSALAKGSKKLLRAPDLKQSLRETQAKVNRGIDESGKTFDTIEKAVEDRGISKVPIHSDIIDTAETFLAKTPANKAMIERARTGDYKALRKLQADLRVKGEKALASKLMAENTMGEEILSTRDEVNQAIQNHFENTGNKDLAQDLNKTRNAYRDIQKTYFSTPMLAKVFGKSQKIPKNPLTLLTEESTEMKKFMLAHPEVEKALSKALSHEGRKKIAKKVAGVLGIGTTAEVVREILGGH